MSSSNPSSKSKKPWNMIESKEFWQPHIQQYYQCTLNKSQYCREHDLNYHRFKYWDKKLKEQKAIPSAPLEKLIPVRATEPVIQQTMLCKLAGKDGRDLYIYHHAAFSELLARFF